MRDSSVAGRYARALFLLTEKRGETVAALEDLKGMWEVLKPGTRVGDLFATPQVLLADKRRVLLEGLILKPNMVIAGLGCATQNRAEDVADATLACLLRVVPAAVPGIAFLSGGQSGELASARLNAMNVIARLPGSRLPWSLAFSFARAIQQPALEIWRGQESRVNAAQEALSHRARCNRAALRGEYSAEMERT